jgi:hypothetical protein
MVFTRGPSARRKSVLPSNGVGVGHTCLQTTLKSGHGRRPPLQRNTSVPQWGTFDSWRYCAQVGEANFRSVDGTENRICECVDRTTSLSVQVLGIHSGSMFKGWRAPGTLKSIPRWESDGGLRKDGSVGMGAL